MKSIKTTSKGGLPLRMPSLMASIAVAPSSASLMKLLGKLLSAEQRSRLTIFLFNPESSSKDIIVVIVKAFLREVKEEYHDEEALRGAVEVVRVRRRRRRGEDPRSSPCCSEWESGNGRE